MWKFFKKLFGRGPEKDSLDDDNWDPEIHGDFHDDRSLFGKWRDAFKKYSRPTGIKEGARKIKGRAKKWRESESFNVESLNLSKLTAKSTWIRWSLVVLALYLLSEVVARYVAVLVRPTFVAIRPTTPKVARKAPTEDYGSILNRNMFNVEGKIPDPFDQGMLDCFSQAVRSSRPLELLGTIVMKNEDYSVALVQEGGNPEAVAVKREDNFLDKYQALKVDRQRLCFQVKATQDLEYIEVKDDSPAMRMGNQELQSKNVGINANSEDNFTIKKSFLDDKLGNLNEILQSARAVPYVDGSGAFKGFLIQSIQEDSVFFDLGVRQGDVLNGVNDIKLDNAGKGLEAFQRLRNSPKITLEITRGGQQKTLEYQVQ